MTTRENGDIMGLSFSSSKRLSRWLFTENESVKINLASAPQIFVSDMHPQEDTSLRHMVTDSEPWLAAILPLIDRKTENTTNTSMLRLLIV